METRSSKCIKGRPSIHPNNEYCKKRSTEENTPEENTPEENTPEENTPKENTPEENTLEENTPEKEQAKLFLMLCCAGILFIVIALWFNNTVENVLVPNIEQLKNEFPLQEEDFWLTIKVAVGEIVNFNQPKSIIFIHTSEEVQESILHRISEYASFNILTNSTKPIVINSEDLNRYDILNDYGVFITELKEKLKDNAVVIIKNLDRIPGITAQAFHSLCDEYNPVQEKVLFLFTLKVDSFPKKEIAFIEKKLRKHWSDLHSDKFYPLFARLSTFILQIR